MIKGEDETGPQAGIAPMQECACRFIWQEKGLRTFRVCGDRRTDSSIRGNLCRAVHRRIDFW